MNDQKVDEAKGPVKGADATTTAAEDATEPTSEANQTKGDDGEGHVNGGSANPPAPSFVKKFEDAVNSVKEKFTGSQ